MNNGITHEGVVEHRHYWEIQPHTCKNLPYKIKLIRDHKGNCTWEITAQGRDMRELRRGLEVTDRLLEERYGIENPGRDLDESKTQGKEEVK